MSTTIYICPPTAAYPKGKRHPHRPPRSITLAPEEGETRGRTVSLPADCTDDTWLLQPGCTIITDPDPEPTPIPTDAKPIAAELLALWATTDLPLPPTWPAARLALIAWRNLGPQPVRDTTAREIRLRRLELNQAGTTWSHVLSLSPLPF